MPTPKQEVEIYTAMLTARERQLMDEGMTKEEAEEQAFREVRQEIRNAPPSKLS